MRSSNPYLRAFSVGAVWYVAVWLKMLSRLHDHGSTFPQSQVLVLVMAWVITALLMGVAATKFESLRSWLAMSIGTVVGAFVAMALMLASVSARNPHPDASSFNDTNEMMGYLSNEARGWVKNDRGIDLDYSVNSVKLIEEELARLSKDVDKANPQRGTFGLATGYGAYLGEVLKRKYGGDWARDHSVGGANSYPLTLPNKTTIFPVVWCWKRLTVGEEDNVYSKTLTFLAAQQVETKNLPTK